LHSLRGLLDAIRYRDELDDLDDLDPVDTDWLRAIDPETLASLGDERLGNLISIAEAGNIFDTYIRRMTGQGSRRHTNDNISSEYVTPHRALDISGFLATLSNDEIKEFNLAYDRLKGMSPRDLTGVERLNRQKMDKAFSEINVDRDIVSNSWLYDTDRYLPLTNALLEIAMPESGRNLVTRSPYGRRPAALPEYITTTLRPRSMRDMTVNDLEDAAGKLDRLLYDTELTTDPFLQPSTRERLSRQLKNLELERDRKLALAAISLGNLSTPPSEIRDTFGIDSSHYPRMKEILLDQLEAEGISDNLMQALLRLDTSDLIRNKKGVDGRRIESNKYSARTLGMLDPISGGGMGITRIEPIGPRLDMALEAWEQGDMERARNILRPMISEDIAIAINNRNNQIRGIVGDDPKESPILNLLGLNFSDDSSDDRSKEVIQKMGLAYMLEGFAMRGRQVPDLDDVETDFLDEEMIQAVYDRLEADGIDIRKPQEGGGYFLDLGVIADSAFLSPDILETNDEIWKVDRLDTITYDAPEIAEKAKKFVDDLYELEEQFHNGELDGPMAEWFRENLQGERLNLQHIMQLSNEIANLESPFDPAKARSGARLNGYEASVEVDPRVAIFNKNIKLFKDELDSELLKRSSANLRIRNSFAKSRARSRVASRAEVPDVWGEESADNARERIDATIEARVSSQAVNIWGLDLERGVVPWSMPDLQTGITPPQPSISVEPQPSTVTNDSIRTFKQNFGLSGIYLPLDKTIEADFGEGVKQYTLVTKPAVIDNGSAKLSPEGGFDFGIEGEFTHYLVPSDVLEQVNEMGAFSPEGQALLGSSAIKGSRTKGPALNWGNFSRQITRLGSGETQAYHGSFFAGKATFSPMNGEPIVVDARGSGLSRIMNNNAMLFYDELDVGQWGMGARLDGSAAWARAGVLTPDITALDSLDREMNQVADLAIAFFTKRDAGIDTTPDEKHAALITGNISRAKAIKTMANFNFGEQPIEKRPHHVDYIRALDPSGKGRNTAAFVFFSDNVFDPEKYREVIEQNPDIDIENLGTVDDPVLDLPLNLTEAAILDFGYRDLSGINPVSSVDSPVIPADRTASEVSRLLSGRQSVDEGPSTGRAFKKDVYGSIVFTGHIPTGPIGGRGALRTTGPSPDSSWDVTGAAGALTPADIPSDTPLDKIRQDYLSDFFFLNSSQDRSDDSRFYRMDLVSGNNTILFEDKETGKKYITKYRAAEAGTNSLGFDHPAFGGSENTEENGATNEALGAAVANALGFEVGAVISGGNINEIRKEVIIEPLQNIHGPDIVPLGDEFNGGLPPTPTDAQYTELLGAVDPTDVVRLLLLDGVLNNSDRNAGNLFIKRNPDGTVSLLPIDAGRGVYSNTSRAVDGKIGITFLGPTVPDESKVISIEDDGREQLKKIIVSHLMDTFNNTPTVRKMGLAKVLGKDSVRGQDTSEIKINRPELNSAVDSILSQVAQLRQTIDTNSLNDIERNFGSTESVLSTPVRDVRQAFRERLRWLQEASREDIIRLLEEAYETIQAPFEVDDNA
jgi:hypothetical protein